MKNFFGYIGVSAVLFLLPTITQAAKPVPTTPPPDGTKIEDYTAFPPFLPRVVSPNILFLLDYSQNMVRPVYGRCSDLMSDCKETFYHLQDDFTVNLTSGIEYNGYFDPNSKYEYGNFTGAGGNSGTDSFAKNAAGEWDGSWLNWLVSTQFDLIKIVTAGGEADAAPETGNPHHMGSKGLASSSVPERTFHKFVDVETCKLNAPDSLCTEITPLDITSHLSWVNPEGATENTILSGENDLIKASIDLPFDFEYYGNTYDSLKVGVDGYLVFGDSTETIYNTESDMPNSFAPDNVLAPYWDDAAMKPESSIKSYVKNDEPNRIFVIRFDSMINDDDPRHKDSSSHWHPITYQVLLFEGSNHIIFQYHDVLTGEGQTYGEGKLATIGLENEDGSRAVKYSYHGEAPDGTPQSVSDGMSLLMTPEVTAWTVQTVINGQTKFGPYGSATTYPVWVATEEIAKAGSPASCPTGSYLNKVKDKCYDHQTEGLLQEFRDGEIGGLLGFRLGIMQLQAEDGGDVIKHFNDKDEQGWSSIINDIRNGSPIGETPLSEALYEALGYIKQDDAFDFGTDFLVQQNRDPFYFNSANQYVPCANTYVLLISSGNYSHDYGGSIFADTNTESASFKTDGFRTAEGETTGEEGTFANGGWLDNVAYELRTSSKSTTPYDLRPGTDLPGEQSAGLYVVNTYFEDAGDGTEVLRKAAQYGGFVDMDADHTYDANDCDAGNPDEADRNCDGKPDTYFVASAAESSLRAQIVNAITTILRNSASGTSVSVLSTSAGGEGALYQAYFYPAKVDEEHTQYREARWPGYLRSFFIDRFQNLRDDSPASGGPDNALVLDEDRAVRMFLDGDNSVKVNLYQDSDGDGKISGTELNSPVNNDPLGMDEISTLWEGGKRIAERDKSKRNIYLWVDRDNSGQLDHAAGSTEGDFSATSAATGETLKLATNATDRTTQANVLKPYFRAGDSTKDGVAWISAEQEAENLIDYILGLHVEDTSADQKWEYRGRCIYAGDDVTADAACRGKDNEETHQKVWPLGDIVFSTPTLVAGPTERYDKIYSDVSYMAFRNAFKGRRQMIYVGANDGMLHAFNGGAYIEGDNSDTSSKQEFGYFVGNPDGENGSSFGFSDSDKPKLGDELWAFLPHDNLPHMPWLACNGSTRDPSVCGDSEYTHVYYVDNRPKVTDVQIFDDIDGQAGVTHTNGWGTILILSMRLGGGAMDLDVDGDSTTAAEKFRSAYYVLDITDPEEPPRLLWRFTDDALGFSTGYPAIVRVEDETTSEDSWFMVVGSGPTNGAGVGNRDYDHKNTTTNGKIFVWDLETGDLDTHDTGASLIMGDASTVDVDRDFSVDVIYMGSSTASVSNSGGPAGRVYRINTGQDAEPANWTLSTLFDVDTTTDNDDPDQGKDMGPLLVGPSVAKDKKGNLWVYFGSGQLKNRDDLSNSDKQRFYGIKDSCWESTAASKCDEASPYAYDLNDLLNTTGAKILDIANDATMADQVRTSSANTAPCGGVQECSFQILLDQVNAKKGWYFDLDVPSNGNPSERVLSKSSVLGGIVLFTSYKPSGDMCSIFGDSFLNGVFYETGTAYSKSIIGSHLENPTTGEVLTDSDGNPLNGDEYVTNSSGELVHKDTGVAAPSGAVKVFDKTISIGFGMPTSVGVAIGESTSGFIQKSTGEIKQIQTDPAYKLKSGPFNWREESTGGGNAGVEVIYKHIVR